VASAYPLDRRGQAVFGRGWRVEIPLTKRKSMDYYTLKWEKRSIFSELTISRLLARLESAQCLPFRQRVVREGLKKGNRGWRRIITGKARLE